ncbi:MAG: phosphatase PAP2 family protein [Candidatus Odinarchaeota archaeon]
MKNLKARLTECGWDFPITSFVAACWIILALVFAIYDLQISIAIVDRHSSWAEFIADYGEVPGHLVTFLSLLIIFRLRGENPPIRTAFFWLLVLIGSTSSLYGVVKPFVKGFSLLERKSFLVISACAIFAVVLQAVLEKVERQHLSNYGSLTKTVLLIAIINPLLFVQTVKILWGRIRFRDLQPDYSDFTPWFVPRGITGHFSFPSGHTAMGWMLLPLFSLIRDKEWKIKVPVFFAIIAWGFTVAAGRIVIGAHYASDTLFPSGVAIISYIILKKKYDEVDG